MMTPAINQALVEMQARQKRQDERVAVAYQRWQGFADVLNRLRDEHDEAVDAAQKAIAVRMGPRSEELPRIYSRDEWQALIDDNNSIQEQIAVSKRIAAFNAKFPSHALPSPRVA